MNHKLKELDDVDDDLFISKKPQNYIFADKKANDINERTSKMLLNTRSLVQESEAVGQSTLEMLSTQRETLERVETDLDSINAMNRSTQKHLNSMKSFFGGIKSLFSSSNPSATTAPIAPSTRSIPKSATLASMPTSSSTTVDNSPKPGRSHLGGVDERDSSNRSASVLTSAKSEPVDEFDANLSEIGFGLGRLKEMAMRLGDEIGDQNDMLDRITNKSERAGDSIKHQNRQMQQLLKKG